MVRDLRFAVRQLFKAPGFTIAAVTVLALGIGVNTAVFNLVNTLFFAPPAYTQPHEMVQGLVGLCACYLPARAAMRLDPVEALRSE